MLYTLISSMPQHATQQWRGTDRHTRFRLHMQGTRFTRHAFTHNYICITTHAIWGSLCGRGARVVISFFFLASTYHVPVAPFANWSFGASDPTASTVRSAVG